eukprot:15121541-Heterocapsa_arctica.AAC.1
MLSLSWSGFPVSTVDRYEVDTRSRASFRDGVNPSPFVKVRVLALGKNMLDFSGVLDHDSHPPKVLSSASRTHRQGKDR